MDRNYAIKEVNVFIDRDTSKITKSNSSQQKRHKAQKCKEKAEETLNYDIYKSNLIKGENLKVKKRLEKLLRIAKRENDTAFLNAPLKQQLEIAKYSFNFM